jgi:hypothetical protein
MNPALARLRGKRPIRVQEPCHRGDQAFQRSPVGVVLAAEVGQHLHLGPLGFSVPGVVGQLQGAHHRAVAVLPWRRPPVHGLENLTYHEVTQRFTDGACIYADPGFSPGCGPFTCDFSPSRSPEPRLAAERGRMVTSDSVSDGT